MDARNGLARLRRVAWVVCLLGSVAAFILTFALTEQAPGETTALSQSVECWVTTGDTAQSAATSGSGGSPEGGGGAAGALLSVANIRRWAHVPEFFLQGLFLFGAAALWPQGRHGARRGQGPRGRLLVALAACAACSLFDQVHKAFVPGREFDALDLPFDAAGYLFALLLVVFIAGVRRLWCPVRRERRPLP